ncbi:MAG: HAD family phosphatase [Clostridia bacterium]|nr:HAD family phosphatase [Clostridia bacterium]
MVKMILTDLDHTLLRQDGTVSEKTLRVLAECRAKGIRFAIATARYWIGAERYIRLLKPDYEITTDGTVVHSGGECIYSCAFTVPDTNRIIQSILEAAPGTEITAACGKTVYWNSRHIAESERLHKAVYCDYSSALDVRANKIAAELPEESIAREMAAQFNCKLQCYRGEKLYAFMPAGSGKTAAIKALAEASGISPADTVAFGDDLNDIEMLKLCGKGIAVTNAVPETREAADEIAASNDEDGVAGWLADHCL